MSEIETGPSVFVGAFYDRNEMRTLPVSTSGRVACGRTSNVEAKDPVGMFYKKMGRLGLRGLAPGADIHFDYSKWLKR